MPCSDAAARSLYRANSPQLVGIVRVPGAHLRRFAVEATDPSFGVRCHACRRADQDRFRRGEQPVFHEGIVWRGPLDETSARATAEVAAGRHVLQHQADEPIRLALPGAWLRTWLAETGTGLGAVMVSNARRLAIVELPPPALRGLLLSAARDEQRLSETRGLNRQAEEVRRCRIVLEHFGLVEPCAPARDQIDERR